jgi:hypothetical protein
MTRITGILHQDLHTFMISPSFVLRMRNVSNKSYTENQTRILGSTTFFVENRAVYEIMWKKHCRARQATDDNTAQALCMLDN